LTLALCSWGCRYVSTSRQPWSCMFGSWWWQGFHSWVQLAGYRAG
jgi:hypothetical protein